MADTSSSRLADLTEADLSHIVPIDYDWREKPQIAYRPWKNGPYHITMGTYANRCSCDGLISATRLTTVFACDRSEERYYGRLDRDR